MPTLPPANARITPPLKVEVALVEVARTAAKVGVEVAWICPVLSKEITMFRLLVVVEIAVPKVSLPTEVEQRYESTMRPWVLKKVVDVALAREEEVVAVRVPTERLPMEEEDKYESTILSWVEKKVVEVAFSMVMPPVEAMEKAVEVPPAVGSATTWKRVKLEREEVAETVSTARGEVVAMPTLAKELNVRFSVPLPVN